MSTTETATTEVSVNMAQIAVIAPGEIARTVLGSCIGLVLHHRRLQIAAIAHIVLPNSEGRGGPPGKFADTAVPEMLRLLLAAGGNRSELRAKVTGGASMFGGSGPIQIGAANAEAVKQLLSEQNIPLVSEHVGGGKGRRISFDSVTGNLTVEMVKSNVVII